jgi:hypothetical protein
VLYGWYFAAVFTAAGVLVLATWLIVSVRDRWKKK